MSPPDALATVSAFAAALADPSAPVPAAVRVERGDRDSRFAIHRNNVWVARLDALDALFPVARRLVGDAFFHALGRRFFAEAAPRNPVIAEWATPFAVWLTADAETAEWPWLADVVRLEAVRLAAHHAAEASPLALSDLAGVAPEVLVACRVALHPSLAVVASAFPIGSIWAAHQGEGEPEPLATDAAETVMVLRPRAEVETVLLPPGEAAFVTALDAGAPLAAAADAALAVDPDFDLGPRLVALVRLGAVVALA